MNAEMDISKNQWRSTEIIFAKNFARNHEKNNTWNIRPLDHESFVPETQGLIDPAYYIEDCRILEVLS